MLIIIKFHSCFLHRSFALLKIYVKNEIHFKYIFIIFFNNYLCYCYKITYYETYTFGKTVSVKHIIIEHRNNVVQSLFIFLNLNFMPVDY